MTAGEGMVTVPRPDPGEVLVVIAGADGAVASVQCPRACVEDGVLSRLDDSRRLLREQAASR